MNVPLIDGFLPAKVRQVLYLVAVALIVVSGTADAVYAVYVGEAPFEM